ncbi:NAD(P)/FAD-dependent oxidoreductase [Flavivirga spongiicola]|uniref:NAD(P)/FAD-dependent oxidoreductase n=1 Tax=Flavivirga spongiicola TaxID=421621 RepID=A0ABU7XN17_9FLAO|nr:NAD(P)/FAD-dependent oxidoreductase [Flavivirga sp. MEBiC05379]MDO5981808.1 NAD(P)/FAD-dependent oxidoreductase [Flavivirga sp. MEBiC05379]
MNKTAIIIGAGPAGLTAAYELIKRTDIKPIVVEQSNKIGGISRTEVYKGNRIDIGGHRFFSKSDIVMQWWQHILPVQGAPAKDEFNFKNEVDKKKLYRKLKTDGPDPEKVDKVMLIRSRLSRIFFLRRFFDYPISINWETISALGFIKLVKIGWTYLLIRVFPIKNIESLEEFFISRFGKELYETFFKDYTEKVWGTPCSEISASWGAQRIKKLSVSRTILHAIRSLFIKAKTIEQKKTDTSLIEQFMYPKLGPGQMWETVAKLVIDGGGQIIMNSKVTSISFKDHQIKELGYSDSNSDSIMTLKGDYFLSTMPVKHLIKSMGKKVPSEVQRISKGLQYRDFITVGILLNKLKIKSANKGLISDNWIYIQEKEVKIGRLQIFNNWSPYLVANDDKVWIGLEYFCNVGDELWQKEDDEFIKFAIKELASINIIEESEVIDSTIIKVPKAYPAYFGTYSQFNEIRNFTNKIENLFLIGRNGMHKYNNQDHSMITAITSVNNIINGELSKNNIWDINLEKEYHEEK